MATTTRAVLRQRLSEHIGDYYAVTATGGSTTTIVTAEFGDRAAGDDAFPGWWALATDNADSNNGELRRVSPTSTWYVNSTTTLTVGRAFSNAVATGTFELHRYDPDDLHRAINTAIRQLFPTLYLPVVDETLVIDSLIVNGTFEDYTAGVPDNWTAVSAPTLAQETNIVYQGRSSIAITGGSGDHITQTIYPNMVGIGDTITFKCWVYTETASSARLTIAAGGATDTSDYHSGNGSWEELSVSIVYAADDDPVSVQINVETANIAYADLAHAYVLATPVYRYTVPTTMAHGPHFVSQQAVTANPYGPYRKVNRVNPLRNGRVLRLEGMGYLTQPSSDTATTEVGGPRVDLITAKAAEIFWNQQYGQTHDQRHKDFRDDAAEEVAVLMNTPGVRMLPMPAEINDYWHVTEDSTGRVLRFDRIRESTNLVN